MDMDMDMKKLLNALDNNKHEKYYLKQQNKLKKAKKKYY